MLVVSMKPAQDLERISPDFIDKLMILSVLLFIMFFIVSYGKSLITTIYAETNSASITYDTGQ